MILMDVICIFQILVAPLHKNLVENDLLNNFAKKIFKRKEKSINQIQAPTSQPIINLYNNVT